MQLPSGRKLAYWNAKLMQMDDGADHITYSGINQETKKWELTETYGGKLVENCLAEGTNVLTDNGIKLIEEVTLTDRLWDGSAWVAHEGLIAKGDKEVISVDSVEMTPDHKVFTEKGWKDASSCDRYNRYDVPLPHCDFLRGLQRSEKPLEHKMPMRKSVSDACVGIQENEAEIMRLHEGSTDQRETKDTRNVRNTAVQRMALDEREMRMPDGAGVEKLRRTRDSRLQRMVGELREILRRHGPILQKRSDARQDRREQGLLARELQMGHNKRAGKEQKILGVHQHSVGQDDCFRSIRTLRDRSDDSALQTESRGAGKYVVRQTGLRKEVFDIKNAGPNHRFTVMGDEGPMLVHNCVQAIGRDGLAEAMLRVTDMGYKIVMHVHDEMIVEVEDSDTEAYSKIAAAMGVSPTWMPDLLLRGDGYETSYYRKD